jgi:hypothetical protein
MERRKRRCGSEWAKDLTAALQADRLYDASLRHLACYLSSRALPTRYLAPVSLDLLGSISSGPT